MTPEWIMVWLAVIGMVAGFGAWALSHFQTKDHAILLAENMKLIKDELTILQEDIKVLFSNHEHYRQVIDKNQRTMESVEFLFQDLVNRRGA